MRRASSHRARAAGEAIRPAAEIPLPAVPVIRPTAVFGLKDAQDVLGLAKSSLPREIRLGRLRAAKRAGKYMILGEWILQWIKAGELPRGGPATGEGEATAGAGK
jgi:hypothetical protein